MRSYISVVQVHSDDEDPPIVRFSGIRPKKENAHQQQAEQTQQLQEEQDQLTLVE